MRMNTTNKELSWLVLGFMILIIFIQMCSLSDACLDTERIALLEIKSVFNSPYSYPFSSWGLNANCCSWDRIECDPSTGRIMELDLDSARDWNLGDWYLNASLFLPFQQLKTLDLSNNQIVGCIKNEGFEKLSKLENLEFLDLGDNKLNGTLNIEDFNNLTSLENLYIEFNEIEGFKSLHGSEEVLKLSNLEHLGLSYNNFNNSILPSLSGLSSLKVLYIDHNQLKGVLNLKELDHASSKLEELSLGGNQIEKIEGSRDMKGLINLILNDMVIEGKSSLLESLGALPNLKTLHLSFSKLRGRVIGEGSYNLSNMEELYLDESSLDEKSLQSLGEISSLKLLSLTSSNGSLPFRGWPNFKNLEHLYLDDSTIESEFLQTVGMITSLKTLSLRYCQLNGTIPTHQGLCQLKHLQELDLSYNKFSGSSPSCLANLTSLQRLDLSANNLIGDISLSPLSSLTSLQHLDISYNLFHIPISLSTFFNHSKLTFLNGGDNKMYADTEEYHTLIPKFQLVSLLLNGDGNVGRIPKFLYYQQNLKFIDLSDLKMEGQFPYWLLENNTKLETLYLANNSLSGSLQLPIHPHMNLTDLDISGNCFYSYIPMEIGTHFPSLEYLSMSKNSFSGNIPSSFGNMSLLLSLDVSGNHLSSNIPLGIRNMPSLEFLDLSKNKIFGSLPSKIFPPRLKEVHLSTNKLQGSLENAFYDSTMLKVLDLSHNNFSGSIPIWISTLSYLSYLSLGHNNLSGQIPFELCKLEKLSVIDLSNNNLFGHIIPCLRVSPQEEYHYAFIYKRTVSYIIKSLEFTEKYSSYNYTPLILSFLVGIDLSSNNLSGKIPLQFGNFFTLKVLNLSHNCLTGPIPSTFSNLSAIESLDLSYNKLDEEIPPQLTQLKSLEVFSVAHNNLSGKTPERVAQFGTFEQNSYEANPLLCGLPLLKSCNTASPSMVATTSMNENEDDGFIDMDVFCVSFVVAYIIMLLGVVIVLCINPYWRRVWFYFVEVNMKRSYYFLVDNIPFLSKLRLS